MSAGNNAYTCAVIDACLQIISQLTMAHIFDDIQTLDVYRMMPDQSPEKAKFVVMMHNRFHDLDKLRLGGRNQDMVDMLGKYDVCGKGTHADCFRFGTSSGRTLLESAEQPDRGSCSWS